MKFFIAKFFVVQSLRLFLIVETSSAIQNTNGNYSQENKPQEANKPGTSAVTCDAFSRVA